jgi:hypothetical protein
MAISPNKYGRFVHCREVQIFAQIRKIIYNKSSNTKPGKVPEKAKMYMNTQYRTKDFYVSAYLLAMGHTLRSCERNGRVTTFVFEGSERLGADATKFYSMDNLVNPLKYAQSIRTMKSMLHANENENVNYVEQLTTKN